MSGNEKSGPWILDLFSWSAVPRSTHPLRIAFPSLRKPWSTHKPIHLLLIIAMSADLRSLASFAKAAVAENLPSDAATAIFFLKQAYPKFVVKYEADEDRMVKVGRAIRDLVKCDASDDAKLDASLMLLVQNCEMLVDGLDCPKVRFGKTGINISRVTCGGMRLQQAWGPSITSMDQVTPECQANVVAILRQAINHGINHIETARGYGCSELQLGVALEELFAEGFVKREDLIIQTKVNPFDTAEEFRKVF